MIRFAVSPKGQRVPKGRKRGRLWNVDSGTSFGSRMSLILVFFPGSRGECQKGSFLEHSPPMLFSALLLGSEHELGLLPALTGTFPPLQQSKTL